MTAKAVLSLVRIARVANMGRRSEGSLVRLAAAALAQWEL
jgi:hypothetical protein